MYREGRANTKRRRWRIVGIGAVVLALLAGGAVWYVMLSKPLLASTLTDGISGFTPYFYKRSIPAGYAVDMSASRYSGGLLFVMLRVDDGPAVVLTEQALPYGLSAQTLQQNTTKVEGAAGQAQISTIEGRRVGTLSTKDKTLIILNAPANTSQEDLQILLQRLRPL